MTWKGSWPRSKKKCWPLYGFGSGAVRRFPWLGGDEITKVVRWVEKRTRTEPGSSSVLRSQGNCRGNRETNQERALQKETRLSHKSIGEAMWTTGREMWGVRAESLNEMAQERMEGTTWTVFQQHPEACSYKKRSRLYQEEEDVWSRTFFKKLNDRKMMHECGMMGNFEEED